MFHILGFLFIIVIAVIIIGLALVGSVLRAVFGLGKRSPSSGSDRNGPNNNSGSRRYYHQTQANDKEEIITGTGAKHKKLFDDNEGEYVDYERNKRIGAVVNCHLLLSSKKVFHQRRTHQPIFL